MTPEECARVQGRLKDLTEALGVVRSHLRDVWEGAGAADPLDTAQGVWHARTALADVRSAMATVIEDLETMGGMAAPDTNEVPGSLSSGGLEDLCGCMPVTTAQTPENRPPVEHGDEVAF